MSDKTELESCPFCGGHARLRQEMIRDRTLESVTCDDCHIRFSRNTADDAIAAWNRRATIQPTAGHPVHQVWCRAAKWEDIAADELEHWSNVTKTRTLYTAPVAPADAVRDARNEQDAARLDWLLPNLHPANFGFEFEGDYEWDSEAEFLAKFRKAIDAAMRSTTPPGGQ